MVFFLIAYWWILLFYLFYFLVHKGLGIVWLPMTHVCGYAFIHGLEAVWKLRFSWKMNVHCCEVHLGEYYVFNFSCALWWSKLWINALTGENPSSGSFKLKILNFDLIVNLAYMDILFNVFDQFTFVSLSYFPQPLHFLEQISIMVLGILHEFKLFITKWSFRLHAWNVFESFSKPHVFTLCLDVIVQISKWICK